MAVDFEGIYQALFDRLGDVLGADINSSTRQPKTWDEIPPEQQPALLVLEGEGTATRELGCPSIWTIRPEVIFYVRAPVDPDQNVGTTINALLKKVDCALKRQFTDPSSDNPETNLGLPNVARCWRMDQRPVLGIEGTNGQSLVAMTIEIVANDFE